MQKTENRMPQKGKSETIIQRLRTYIDPLEPEWFQSLVPASEQQILKLQQILELDKFNLKLPLSYIEFLRYAGEGAGGLFLNSLRADMSLSSLINRNIKLVVNENERIISKIGAILLI